MTSNNLYDEMDIHADPNSHTNQKISLLSANMISV